MTSLLSVFLQASAGVPAGQLPAVPAQEDTLSLLDLIAKGGFLMIPIGLLSLISIYVLVERLLAIRKAGAFNQQLLDQTRDNLLRGNLDAASSLCKGNGTPAGLMLAKGISRIGSSTRDIESAMEGVGKLELGRLEKNIGILGVIAGIAPMFGFIGTIAGVIKIFYNISLADNISIGLISGGLYEKMITSAAGLVVGVFSFVSYHYLTMAIDKLSLRMEAQAMGFMDVLNEKPKA
jgi:biopolymer transport protein ExbB